MCILRRSVSEQIPFINRGSRVRIHCAASGMFNHRDLEGIGITISKRSGREKGASGVGSPRRAQIPLIAQKVCKAE